MRYDSIDYNYTYVRNSYTILRIQTRNLNYYLGEWKTLRGERGGAGAARRANLVKGTHRSRSHPSARLAKKVTTLKTPEISIKILSKLELTMHIIHDMM